MPAHKGVTKSPQQYCNDLVSGFAVTAERLHIELNATPDMLTPTDNAGRTELCKSAHIIGQTAVKVLRAIVNGTPVTLSAEEREYKILALYYIGNAWQPVNPSAHVSVLQNYVMRSLGTLDRVTGRYPTMDEEKTARDIARGMLDKLNRVTSPYMFDDTAREEFSRRLEENSDRIGYTELVYWKAI